MAPEGRGTGVYPGTLPAGGELELSLEGEAAVSRVQWTRAAQAEGPAASAVTARSSTNDQQGT